MVRVQEIRRSSLAGDVTSFGEDSENRSSVLEAFAKTRKATLKPSSGNLGGQAPNAGTTSAASSESRQAQSRELEEKWLIGESGFARPSIPSRFALHYEQIKIAFLAKYASANMKSVLFVATAPGHGTSTSAYHFACALAKDPQTRVLLIDANVNRGPRGRSFSDAKFSPPGMIASESYPIMPIYTETDNLQFARNVSTDAEPLPVFQSVGFSNFLEEAKDQFDYVIIDAPPIQDSAESLALCAQVDGVVLVVQSERTRKKLATWTRKRIEEVGGKLVGVILNKRKYYIPRWLYDRL
jgi:protein-tyrosine kinase